MVESAPKSRRWHAYVCPGCRLVFRVPSDHDGVGVVCPSCRRLMRVPGESDDVPPLQAGPTRKPVSVEEEKGKKSKQRRRHRKGHRHQGATPGWESSRQRRRLSGQRLPWIWLTVGGVVVFVTLFAVMRLFRGEGPDPGTAGGEGLPSLPPLIVEEIGGSDSDAADGGTEVDQAEAGDPADVLIHAEPAVRSFIAARSVEEMLPLVRNAAELEPKLRAWYQQHGFDDIELQEFGLSRQVGFRGGVASVGVMCSDFKKRQVAVEKTDDGFKVDWESWVVWSELPLDEFLERKPVEPVLFRVNVKQGEYYNYEFFDDGLWRCYELDFPDRMHPLYGYVERGSELDMKLLGMDNAARPFVLRLRFPENARSTNLVFIDSVVTSGWVTGVGE